MMKLKNLIYILMTVICVTELYKLMFTQSGFWQQDFHCVTIIVITIFTGHYFLTQLYNEQRSARQ